MVALNRKQVEAYLERIGMGGPVAADCDTLRCIQEHHIYAVPLENLDVIAGKVPLSLNVGDLYDKVVIRRRGGICYELNVLLASLLESIGYRVRLMSARHPKYGDDFDHAFLVVNVPGDGDGWLVDVGFADNVRAPLRITAGGWQSDGRDDYAFRPSEGTGAGNLQYAAIEREGEGRGNPGRYWNLIRRRGGEESVLYTFTLQERSVEEYGPRCIWYCTSGESRFTKGPLVCIERPEGRISLTMNRLINTFNDQRIREDINSRETFVASLREVFGIELDAECLRVAPPTS